MGEETRKTPATKTPATPREAGEDPDIQVYMQVTDGFPGQKDYGVIIDTVRLLREQHGDNLVAYLKQFWLAWSTRRTQDNRPYSKTSLVWLCEWAVQGNVPAPKGNEPKLGKEKTNKNRDAILKVASYANANR